MVKIYTYIAISLRKFEIDQTILTLPESKRDPIYFPGFEQKGKIFHSKFVYCRVISGKVKMYGKDFVG